MRSFDELGFTFIEIVFVVVIFGLMLMVAAPSFMKWGPNIRLKSNARDLYTNLQLAKFEAVKRNVCVGVSFDLTAGANPGGYFSFLDDGTGGGNACNKTLDGGELVLNAVTFTDDTELIGVTMAGGGNSLCFNPTSVACNSQGGDIQLGSTITRTYTVQVKASGGLSIN